MQGQEDLYLFPNHITCVSDHHKVDLVGKSALIILGYFGEKKTFAEESTAVSHTGLQRNYWNQYSSGTNISQESD